jgi:hypothetical protein
MAINQSAVNVAAVNGTASVFNTQLLTVNATVSPSIVSQGIVTLLLSVIVSTTASVYKGLFQLLVVASRFFAGTGALNGNALNTSTINAQATGVVSSNSTIVTNFFFYKTYIATSTVLNSIRKDVLGPNVFLITVNSTVTLTKAINKLIDLVLSTATATMTRALILFKELLATVTSSITLLATRLYYRTLTVVSTSVSTIVKSIQKTLTILVNCGIILVKGVRKIITVIVTSTVTMIRSAISFIRFPLNRLIYAASKIRKVFYT